MQIRQFYTPGLAIRSYLIFDEKTHRAAVIDPTREIEVYIAMALRERVEITDILETHVHADFVSGAPELKAALNGKPQIHCSGMGGEEWIPRYADKIVHDHDRIQLGDVLLEAVHTPGHTPEHIIWLAYDTTRSANSPCIMFSGDLLFVGSVGRPDLLGKHIEDLLAKQLYRSLFSILKSMDDHLQVYPAHGAESLCGKGISARDTTTLGYEKKCNPWLLSQDYNQWHEGLFKEMPPVPSYFKRMKNINVVGFAPKHGDVMPPVISQQQFDEIRQECIIVDVRNAEAFALRHLMGSVNIPFSPQFSTWAGGVLPADKGLILIMDNISEALPVVQALRLIGLDNIRGICTLGEWNGDGKSSLVELPTISAEELAKSLKDYYVLDVRAQGEWNLGHIEGAHHLDFFSLQKSLEAIPKNTPLAVICKSGIRSSIAASILVNAGEYLPFKVIGGMQAWNALRKNA